MHTIHSNIREIQKTSHRALYTVGRLMSPEEVEQATEGHAPLKRRRVRGHWLLCGNCSQQMFDAIARENEDSLRYAFGVFASTEGTQFMLVTHQLESTQHRFLVPLWDPRVPDFLDALSQGRITTPWHARATPKLLSGRPLRMQHWLNDCATICMCLGSSNCRRCSKRCLS